MAGVEGERALSWERLKNVNRLAVFADVDADGRWCKRVRHSDHHQEYHVEVRAREKEEDAELRNAQSIIDYEELAAATAHRSEGVPSEVLSCFLSNANPTFSYVSGLCIQLGCA
jgi:uncharacterized membrane protein YkoI